MGFIVKKNFRESVPMSDQFLQSLGYKTYGGFKSSKTNAHVFEDREEAVEYCYKHILENEQHHSFDQMKKQFDENGGSVDMGDYCIQVVLEESLQPV